MSYVVIRSCTKPVDVAAFCRWYRKSFGGTQDEASSVIERLRKGRRHTFSLGERKAEALLRHAVAWGLAT
jgi:hypothetical protein